MNVSRQLYVNFVRQIHNFDNIAKLTQSSQVEREIRGSNDATVGLREGQKVALRLESMSRQDESGRMRPRRRARQTRLHVINS